MKYSLAAAAAKSLQSCPTLCDPIDSSPPGSPIPGILQARTLEWVAILFSNAWKWSEVAQSCPTLSNPMDCDSPGSSAQGIFQARVLKWDISDFLEEISSLSHSVVFLYFFALIAEEGFLIPSLLFFGTLHSDAYIFLFLLCFSLLFFSQLFVRPPQTAILLFCISFPWGWSYPCLLYNVTNLVHSSWGILSIRSSPLNLFLTSTV